MYIFSVYILLYYISHVLYFIIFVIFNDNILYIYYKYNNTKYILQYN